MPFIPVRRTTAVVAVMSVVAIALTACSAADTQSSGAVSSATDADPIVIEHAYGTLELDQAPERVITLGLLETDIAVDLGVAPVAMAKFFATEDGVAPWLEPALDEVPEIIDTTTQGANGAELDVEYIASLQPDLIIANTYSQLGQYYDQLSQIAPVLGPSDTNYLQLPWRDQTVTIAEALGKSDETDALIDETEAELAAAVEQYPDLAGHDYTLSLGTPDQIKVMNDPNDASVEVLEAFGLSFSATAGALPSLADGSGSAGVSEENISALDADVVMIGYFGDETRDRWESSTLFQQLTAVQDGGYIDMDLSESTALRNPSPLSITYVIEQVIAGQIAPALQR